MLHLDAVPKPVGVHLPDASFQWAPVGRIDGGGELDLRDARRRDGIHQELEAGGLVAERCGLALRVLGWVGGVEGHGS